MADSTVTIVGNCTRHDDSPVWDADLAQRITKFWHSVHLRGPDDCWLWTGYAEKGYGRFYFEGRMVGAHELALTFTTGERRHPDLVTCHACDTPLCCNPAHLRFDTHQGNADDARERNRLARGERQGSAKLTGDAVLLMRERHANGATGRNLAREYGVSEGLVNDILRGKRWAHVGGPIREQHGNWRHGRYAA